ncbi:hypothetical protein Rleg4DRAFT_2312 [Rhizobium leguminosarum bv. trifolii WSM2297]|uniref:Uncharacterized protein n=1 Tax=Rhizobium leguminosarum bv. trifolii WSM2297 TaxID=754762 RepID=J0CM75_RHILT|nr:hypothetical protein [Rhizobium leguminosarum]EJC80675.1 hypothetical protein Rleg4DRAFT_2312 [Rhizobium leguminosarum bv. trifolii WSM2297]
MTFHLMSGLWYGLGIQLTEAFRPPVVATTHRYAAADVEMMRKGLEKAGVAGDLGVHFRPNDAGLQLLNGI